MDRRTLLFLIGAAGLAGCGQSKANVKGLRVVLAGAGIIGASIAYHLAKSGASVTVIDKQGPATHASRGTFAWINATWAKQPQHYHSLNQEGVANWRVLQEVLNLPIRWGGSLEWFGNAARQQKLGTQIAEQISWGEPARMIGASEFASLEPGINFPSESLAAFSPNDAAIDPVIATHRLLYAAEQMGAKLHFPSELIDVSLLNGRLNSVTTSTGSIEAQKLVLATGAEPDVTERVGGINIPQRSTPGVIAITKPMPRVVNRVIAAPGVHLHQRDDGCIVLGEQEGAPQNEAHAMRLKGRPNEFPIREIAQQHANRILAIAEKFVPAIAGAQLADAYIGWRPLPTDGHPVLGASGIRPDVYYAIMHSGVTLAPIVGQLVAHELSEAGNIEQLKPYRPTRSFSDVKRY